MKAGRNTQAGFGARCAAVLCVCATAALAGAAPAAAAPGGASTGASYAAQAGSGIAFTALRVGAATWYGPGFYGKRTACGQTLRPGTLGVAHRSLPCGTVVRFVFGGRQIVTRVIDRGPYAKGFAWDLTNGTREALGFEGSGRIRYAVASQYARP
jgi:rare lipoprotein A (peptidoglycan hydrolase)